MSSNMKHGSYFAQNILRVLPSFKWSQLLSLTYMGKAGTRTKVIITGIEAIPKLFHTEVIVMNIV